MIVGREAAGLNLVSSDFRVDLKEVTPSRPLGIPTELSVEAKSRPFEAPVITVRLPGERGQRGTEEMRAERRNEGQRRAA